MRFYAADFHGNPRRNGLARDTTVAVTGKPAPTTRPAAECARFERVRTRHMMALDSRVVDFIVKENIFIALVGTPAIILVDVILALSDAAKQIWFTTGPLTLPSPEGRGFHPLPPPGQGPGMRACAGSLMKAK